jgi:hypothetical protein
MTTHAHHPSGEVPAARGSGPPDPDQAESAFARPSWLLPALAAGLVALGLVAAGVVSLSTMLFVVAFGGMMLMHTGGHGGHGGHGGNGESHDTKSAGHAGYDSSGMGGDRPSGSQSQASDSTNGLDRRASDDPGRSATHDDDQHSSHSCH